MKNQFRNIFQPSPPYPRETVSKACIDNEFNELSITKSSAHVNFDDKKLENVHYENKKSYIAIGEDATAEHYVD